MNKNTYIDTQVDSVPFWKVICSSILDIVLLIIISILIYTLWIIAGLPNTSWIIIFVITSVIISVIIKRCCGTTLGNLILRIKPSDSQINKATLYNYAILSIIAIIVIISSNYSKTAKNDRIIENEYYEISIPNGWEANQIAEDNSVLSCIAVEMNPEKSAYFYTINYNISGLPFDSLISLAIGGLNRNNISDAQIKEINYHNCEATEIKGTINGNPIKIIVFLAPSGKLSYIISQSLSEQEFDQLLSNVHLKNTNTPFADFDEIWKQFYGENLECKIYQEIEDGLTLEGWKYDKENNTVSMNLICNADSSDIEAYFNDTEERNYFISEMTKGQVMPQIAKNYNKSVLIILKDTTGNTILSLPLNQNN